MKKKALALLAILLTSFALSEAKAVSRAEYCATLRGIIACYVLQDEDIEAYEDSRSYNVFDAWRDHCK